MGSQSAGSKLRDSGDNYLDVRRKQEIVKGEVELPYDSASSNENVTMASAPAPIPANPQPIEQVPVRIEAPSKPKEGLHNTRHGVS